MQMSDAFHVGDFRAASRTQPNRRVFSRLTAFDVACPNCGAVDSVTSAAWWKRKTNFDPWRSRWRCRVCRRVFAVGVVL
jgi:transposase-like protein